MALIRAIFWGESAEAKVDKCICEEWMSEGLNKSIDQLAELVELVGGTEVE